MAHNFRITGNFYVSKSGNDSNAGTTPDSPKGSIQAALSLLSANNQTIVVGAGTYEEALSRTGSNFSGFNIIADGNVTLLGNGANSISLSALTGSFNGFTISNYSSIGFSSIGFTNCLLRNINALTNNTACSYSKFINVISSTFSPSNSYCIYINCTMIFGSLNNCYVNGFSNITLTSTAANASDYNNLMGKIRVTASGTYYSLADHQINFPTLNVHSFNLPPLFNDSTKEDFTLQAGSPHLNAAFVGSSGALSTTTGYNIGGTAYAKPFHVTGASEWQVSNGAIWENVTQQGTDIVVTAGNPYGRITSAPLLISSNPVMLGNINYFGLQLFNKSKAGGSDTNKSVPDANMYTGSDPSGGGNPDRLTLEMRFVSTDAKPQAENDWNNGYLLPSGAFGKFVINAQPFVDNSQKGNGEPDYAVTVTNVVVATWVQLRITLRNDYQ